MLSGMSDSAAPIPPVPNITSPNIVTPNIPAARNALRVLTYLASRSGAVSASTLARALDLPRSSAYQLLAVMMDEGFVVHYPEDQAYGLSTLLPEIGTSALRTTRLGRLA
ncbi:MAG: IclR family transcriptional regulator, partial [Glaciihabitans sp.]|nr:IclR family transcriptional regulator [Glaciihabitans sp.]